MKIIKTYLDYQDQKTNVFYFIPAADVELKATLAVFTHGYTSDKSSILNWALRLAEVGAPVALFDLPGHYLGNFSEVLDFDHFRDHGHELFLSAYEGLKETMRAELPLSDHLLEEGAHRLVLGGHSLGSMLALKASELEAFSTIEKRFIGVGLGMPPKDVVHLFDTPFYKATMKVREQLVSPALGPQNVFPWIKEAKESATIKDQDIHFISGEDDLVVGDEGMERFASLLEGRNNRVTIEKPTRLPHHEPQLAASYVKKYLKKISWI